MTINSFYERTTLITSILILNNLILIAINIPNIFLKINLIIFFILLLSFYFIKPKENLYLTYPNNYNHFVKYFRDTYQHGGISMEEMICPFVRLSPK